MSGDITEEQVLKNILTDAKNKWSLDDLATNGHFNSALLFNYGVMWVILSEHVDSCCLLIHSKQTQLGVGRQCTASWDRESGRFTLMSGFFQKKTLSITLGRGVRLLSHSSIFPKKSGPCTYGAVASFPFHYYTCIVTPVQMDKSATHASAGAINQ